MPVKVRKRNGKYRIVEASTLRIAKTSKGTPVDGGGHATKVKAGGQKIALDAAWAKKKKGR